ncbi:MAG: CHAT domain-containing protein [Chloroflexi bacterium]|nr:CHAT domain-containing protein [Chloroflexota bacterium]
MSTAAELASALTAILAEPELDEGGLKRLTQAAARLDAGRVAELLKVEADRQLFIQPRTCVPLAETIERIGVLAEQPALQALGVMTAGDALRELGQYADALRSYDRAGALYRSVGDDIGWARTRLGAAYTRAATVELGPALEEAQAARAILTQHGLWPRLARLESAMGNLLREMGRYDDSLSAHARAVSAAQRIVDPHERDLVRAEVQINSALVYQRLDDYELSERLLRESAETFRHHNRPGPVALAEGCIARGLSARGHVSRALALAVEVRRTMLELGRLSHAAIFGQVAVDCLLELNRPADAAVLADQIVEQLAANSAGVELAKSLLQRAIARERLARHLEAAEDLARAEHLFRFGGCDGWSPVVRLQRARVLERAGAVEAALQEAKGARRELHVRNLNVLAARADVLLAQLLARVGERRSARAAALSARRVARRHGVPLLEYQGLRALGDLAPDPSEALRNYVAAASALEHVQGRILTEQRAGFLEQDQRLSVYYDAIRLCLDQGRARRAFVLAERAKTRALVDALALRSQGIPARTETPETRALAKELANLRRRHERLSSTLFDPRPTDDLAGSTVGGNASALYRELEACQARISAVVEDLRLADSGSLDYLPEVQGRVRWPLRWLGRGTALVEYAIVGDDIAVFVLRRGQPLAAHVARGAATEVSGLIRALQLNVTAALKRPLPILAVHAQRVLGRLYAMLMGPLAQLLKGCHRLLIVPHGVLHSVPFAALHDGTRYLVERVEVGLAPSATVIGYCRRPRQAATAKSLVVANSADGYLPGALEEGRRIGRLLDAECLFEGEATVARVRDKGARASLVHFAAHGHSLADAPLLSYVQLADGRLAALDCMDLLLDCDLVTVSACESGNAVVLPGDEPVGLTRSLLYAGARSVLQSLWRVDDTLTCELMTEFYTRLRSGASRSGALRAAQMHILRSEGSSHPAFWAPFALVGDWRPIQ